jgi:hypothetical protein
LTTFNESKFLNRSESRLVFAVCCGGEKDLIFEEEEVWDAEAEDEEWEEEEW